MRLLGSKPWRLKGEGNAGAVFAYVGDDDELVDADTTNSTASIL